jgi:hypothetical protein
MPRHYKKKTKGRGRKMKIKPVHEKMYGMGHCQCGQMGDGFFGDLVSGIGDLVTFKDPVRSLSAIGTLGLSEGVLAAEKATGKKGSQLIDSSRKIATLIGMPQLGVPAEIVSGGLQAIGHGKKKRRRRRRK